MRSQSARLFRRPSLLASATAAIALVGGMVGGPTPAYAAPPNTAPQGVQVTSTGTGFANLAWSAPDWGISSNQRYTVLVNGTAFAGCATITATTCKVTGGANATTVSLVVRALGDGPTEYLDAAPVQTTLLPPPDKPTGVAAVASGDLRATVSWTAPGSWRLNTVRKYDVLVDGTPTASCQNLAAATLTCAFTGSLGPHAVKVRAVGNTGLSNDSDPAVSVKLVSAPQAPTGIRLTASDAGSGTITWDAHPNGNLTPTYTVKVDGTPVATCTDISATTCSFEADKIAVDVVVTAIGDAPDLRTDSAVTPLTLLSPPDAPTNVRAVAWAEGSATVAWDAPSFNGSNNNTYAVLVGGAVYPACDNLAVTQCVITATAGTTASVVVRAIGDVGLQKDSSPAVITDLPGQPDAVTGISVTARTLGHTRVEWAAPLNWRQNNFSKTYTVSVPNGTGCTAITVLYCDVTGGANTSQTVTVTAIGNNAGLKKAATLPNVAIPAVPGTPMNLRSTSTASGSADIVWDAPVWNNNTSRTYVVKVGGMTVACADPAVEACHITGSGTAAVEVTAVGDDAATLTSAPVAKSFALIAAPVGVVDPVVVDAPAGQSTVTVSWPTLTDNAGNWSGGSVNQYRVIITAKPANAVLSNNGCTVLIDDAPIAECSFDTDKGGTYSVTVTAVNEAGDGTASAEATADLVRSVPTGAVANLSATSSFDADADIATVGVSWNALAAADWNGGTGTNKYRVSIDSPANTTPNFSTDTCTGDLAATAIPSCSFSTDTPGPYVLHVTPKNDAGPGTERTYTVFVATQKPSAPVTDLTVALVAGTSNVEVSWTPIAEAAWNGIVRHYDVQITKPSGAVITNNSCATGLMSGDQTYAVGCYFTTDKPGSYTVVMTPVNEIGAGTSESVTQSVTLQGPTGAVTGLTAVATPITGEVAVTWDQLPEDAWNSAVSRSYTVTVSPLSGVNPNTCTAVPDDPAPSCSFTATVAGAYTITVVPTSEAGNGTVATKTAHVVLAAPTGTVANVRIANTPPSGAVDLTWDRLTTGWNEGQTKQYTVDFGGLTTATSTCDVVVDSDTPGCSFTTTQTGPYIVSVKAVNEAGTATTGTTQNGIIVFKPTVTVAGLTAVASAAPDSSTVTVSWAQVVGSDWRGGTSQKYRVTLTGPTGTVYSGNTCTPADVSDSASPSCQFQGSISGPYTVTVNPVNEGGVSTATAATASVAIVQKPVATVAGVKVLPQTGLGDVQVIWNRARAADWNGAVTTKKYVVTITGPSGATVTPNDCTEITEPTYPACTFTTNAGGSYTVHVALKNEAGVSDTFGTATEHLTLNAPTGQVGAVTATTSAGSGTVDLSWPALSPADWSAGLTRTYAVTITGLTPSTTTCATVSDTANPSCSFTVTTPGAFTAVVKAVNEAGTAATGGSVSGNVIFRPTTTVSSLAASAALNSPTVAVSWAQLGAGDWLGGAEHKYSVTVTKPDGATLSTDTCTGSLVNDSATPTCAFTVNVGGDYVVSVAPKNEAGIGTAVAVTATVKLIPTVAVTNVTVVTGADSGIVAVAWDRLTATAWNGGSTHTYAVTVQKPTGAVVTGSCLAPVNDSTTPGCSFTTDKPGPYTVSVAARTEAGTSSAAGAGNGAVVFTPTTVVSGLTAGASTGSPTVTVAWNPLAADDWLGGTTNTYVVTVTPPTGGVLSNNSCATAVSDPAQPSCVFDGSVGGDYLVQVAPKNEAGTGVAVGSTAHITLAPVATVTGLQVAATAGSPTVDVTWAQLPLTAWNGGSTHTYAVTLQNPAGATVNAGTCTGAVADSATPGCSFTTDRPGAYTVSVAPGNEVTTGTAVSANGTLGSAVPAAPTAVSATTNVDNSIAVSWTAPVSTLLASVTSLSVSATATGYPAVSCTGTITASPCTIAGVAAGVPYTVHVVANGPGGSSTDATDTATPAGLPVAPTQVPLNAVPVAAGSATAGSSITITGSGFEPGSTVVLSLFSNPVSLGTTVADANGNISATVNLPSGTPTGGHTLLATGLDENGDVRYLAKSVAVSPVITTPPITTPPIVTPPQAVLPTGIVGSLTAKQTGAGTRTVTVTWAAGQVVWNAATGRAYRVTVDGPDNAKVTGTCTSPVAAPATSCTFTTDLNGPYVVRVVAATDAGPSPSSAVTTVTVGTAPTAPTAVTATIGANALTVKWTAPTSTGAGIRAYTVTVTAPNYPNRSCAGTVTRSPCTVTGLAAGVRYTPWVIANGLGGDSPMASGTTSVIPTGSVQAPQSVPSAAVVNVSRSAKAGSRLAVTGTGYRSGGQVVLNLYPGGAALGTATASSQGAFSAMVTIPASATGGVAVLATGLNGAGLARYVKTPVRVVDTVAGAMAAGAGTVVKAVATTTGAKTTGTAAGSTVTGSTAAMAVTGAAAGPVILAGFAMLLTGLLMVTTMRKRRTPRNAR